MAISDAQYTAWLKEFDAARVILVEAVANVATVETTRYISSRAYVDSVAGRIYQPVINENSVTTTRRLSINGRSSLTFGDIEVNNADNALDSWLFDDIWANRDIVVLIGDVRWARADFRVVLNGVIEDIGSRSRDTLNFKVRDKLQRLNASVSDFKQGGTTNNKDKLVPIVEGEVFNITPLLSNPALLEYRVHPQWIEGIIEVRDNGVPVSTTGLPSSTGTFNLAVQSFGEITVSVQGDKEDDITYRNTVSKLTQRLVTAFDDVNNRFTDADIDTAQLATFDAANLQPVGFYLEGRANVLNVADQLTSSLGAQISMTAAGLMQIIKIELPAPGTAVEIGINDIEENSLRVLSKLPVQAAQKLGYNKNWTVQKNIDSTIPEEDKSIYAQEWSTVISEDTAVQSDYLENAEPLQKDTMLINETAAQTEADRLLALYKVPRYIMALDGTASLTELELGGRVNLTYPDFDLASGKEGMVMGLTVRWGSLKVNVEVLV